jgi:8-oxo-dGTP pyrophosphatase MutT (NUDIX family)
MGVRESRNPRASPSGHLEQDESVVDGAIREASEEAGVTIDSRQPPGRGLAAVRPADRNAPPATAPAPRGRTARPRPGSTGERHLHADHAYVAVAGSSRPVREPEHQVRWFTQADIATAPAVSEDSRILAVRLLAVTAPQPGPGFQWPPEPGHGTAAGRPRVIAEAAVSARPDSGCLPRELGVEVVVEQPFMPSLPSCSGWRSPAIRRDAGRSGTPCRSDRGSAPGSSLRSRPERAAGSARVRAHGRRSRRA